MIPDRVIVEDISEHRPFAARTDKHGNVYAFKRGLLQLLGLVPSFKPLGSGRVFQKWGLL